MTEADKENKANAELMKTKELDYMKLFGTDRGKRILKDLEVACGFMAPSVCEAQPNSLQTHFNEGKRRIYLRILGMVNKGKQHVRNDSKSGS